MIGSLLRHPWLALLAALGGAWASGGHAAVGAQLAGWIPGAEHVERVVTGRAIRPAYADTPATFFVSWDGQAALEEGPNRLSLPGEAWYQIASGDTLLLVRADVRRFAPFLARYYLPKNPLQDPAQIVLYAVLCALCTAAASVSSQRIAADRQRRAQSGSVARSSDSV